MLFEKKCRNYIKEAQENTNRTQTNKKHKNNNKKTSKKQKQIGKKKTTNNITNLEILF